MPFTRVTLINNTNHKTFGTFTFNPGGQQVDMEAPANGQVTDNSLAGQVFDTVSAPGCMVMVTGPAANARQPAADLGGLPGDDIQDVTVRMGAPVETIEANVIDGGGAPRHDVQNMV